MFYDNLYERLIENFTKYFFLIFETWFIRKTIGIRPLSKVKILLELRKCYFQGKSYIFFANNFFLGYRAEGASLEGYVSCKGKKQRKNFVLLLFFFCFIIF